MRFTSYFLILFLGLLPCSFATPTPSPATTCCDGWHSVEETFIGKNKDVKMEIMEPPSVSPRYYSSLEKRQSTNVCGAICDTNCFLGGTGGPNPNECHVISNALLYDSQNLGDQFNISSASGTGAIVMTYNSCRTFIDNIVDGNLTYCRSDWAAVIDWVAFNCQSTQNAHGGNCLARDQSWMIQIQTAPSS